MARRGIHDWMMKNPICKIGARGLYSKGAMMYDISHKLDHLETYIMSQCNIATTNVGTWNWQRVNSSTQRLNCTFTWRSSGTGAMLRSAVQSPAD